MSHPCLVTLDNDSAARVLFSGDRLVEVDLPVGSRVLYPKPSRAPLTDVGAALRAALAAPQDSIPLSAKLRPGMKLTIAVDDLSACWPRRSGTDPRQLALEAVLELAADHGVDDIEILIATGLNRRLKPKEIRQLVGDRVFNGFWPQRLRNHDPEDPDGMVVVGETEYGEIIELNRRAVESDLVVAINVCLLPCDGGFEAVGVGLASYRSLRAHHNPTVMRRCHSYMDPSSSGVATSIERMGRLMAETVDVFAIELAVNNALFSPSLAFLNKNEDDLIEREKLLLKGLVEATARLPQAARSKLFERAWGACGVIAVHAGEVEASHRCTLQKLNEQYLVPVQGQADVLVAGVPCISPYNTGSFLNPLLVQAMAEGVLFNLYRGAPLVKKGGTMIITHPCTDRFDHEQHAPYIDFVRQLLPETTDAIELHGRYEQRFARNPAFLEMFRRGHCYHPAHPFFVWYSGEAARQHLSRVIVVGTDNEYVPKLLGYETAPNMEEALYRAKGGETKSLDILCLHAPPLVMGDVTV